MKHKFIIAKDFGGFVEGIRYGKQWVIHLQPGTRINEHYVRWIVNRLNGSRKEPPQL